MSGAPGHSFVECWPHADPPEEDKYPLCPLVSVAQDSAAHRGRQFHLYAKAAYSRIPRRAYSFCLPLKAETGTGVGQGSGILTEWEADLVTQGSFSWSSWGLTHTQKRLIPTVVGFQHRGSIGHWVRRLERDCPGASSTHLRDKACALYTMAYEGKHTC